MVFRRRDQPPLLTRVRHALYPRSGWRRAFEYAGHRVRRIPDTPHRIALGFACGVFAVFSPFFGLHFFYAALLAWIVRGNVLASLIGTFFGNPITFPIIASISMPLGKRLLGHGPSGRDYGRLSESFAKAGQGLWEGIKSLFGHGEPHWEKLAAFAQDVILPYFVGGLAPGLLTALASYVLTRPLIHAYQSARRDRLANRTRARGAAVPEADETS